MPELIEIARAKINLTLRVLGRRSDGYHELESIVVFADIGDRLVLRRNPLLQGHAAALLKVSGPFASAIAGENLVQRAIRQVEAAAGRPLAVEIELEKLLPVASGIGGGSADAAAALRAIRLAFPEPLAALDWNDIAGQLGADVPVCLASAPCLMTGIGERLQPLAMPVLDIVLANACEPVPADKTRRVFQALGAGPLTDQSAQVSIAGPLDRSRLLHLVHTIGNDLERPATAVLPAIAAVKSAVADTPDCEAAMLSGAGPTVVGIYPSAEAARDAARLLLEAHPAWWVRAGSTAQASAP